MRDVVVVVPCYREPVDEVRRSIDSALAVANVTRVTLVDDGADQSELDQLAGDRVSVIHLDVNGGPSFALNAGIAAAPDDSIICRLDVRDEYYPEPKARQIETVLSGRCRASCSPHYDPVAGAIHEPPPNWRRLIYTDSCFTGVSTVYERSVWQEVGIDTSFRWAEDWRFSLLIEHMIGFDMFPEVTCSAGMFPGGHSDCTASDEKRRLREDDRVRVIRLARALDRPDQFAHLYSVDWCKKRGMTPMVKRPRRAR